MALEAAAKAENARFRFLASLLGAKLENPSEDAAGPRELAPKVRGVLAGFGTVKVTQH